MFAAAALSLMGYVALNSNRGITNVHDNINVAESGITAVSLATSIIEEATGKMFDAKIEDATTGALTNTNQLTSPNALGPGATEKYRGGACDFNDFDDFNNLFLVFKSTNSLDTARTPGSHWETIVPGIRAKYYVKCKVEYVRPDSLNRASLYTTWHKKITVTVINPALRDTLAIPAVMSFWN